jgi:beta-glucanase (GH16 family)
MITHLRLGSLFTLMAGLSALLVEPPRAADAPPGWKLVWSDEFDGDRVDPAKWDFDLGNGFYNYEAEQWISGWGNDELQYYTREAANASVKDGTLRIRALKESRDGFGYTSARLKTRKRDGTALMAQRYGRFEIRAKLPTGQGIWPAIWMLPQEEKYGGWAASGEIDILEARGQKPHEILGTLHFGSRWPANAEASTTHALPAKQSIADFHVYVLEWEPGEIRWYFDDKLFAKQTSWWSSSKVEAGKGARPTREADLNPWPAPFDQTFYLILNIAVGGRFVGKPDRSTAFPAVMEVDYVRVYEKVGGYGPVKPRDPKNLPFTMR